MPPTESERYAMPQSPSSTKDPTTRSRKRLVDISHTPQRGDEVVRNQDTHGCGHDRGGGRAADPGRRRRRGEAAVRRDESDLDAECDRFDEAAEHVAAKVYRVLHGGDVGARVDAHEARADGQAAKEARDD